MWSVKVKYVTMEVMTVGMARGSLCPSSVTTGRTVEAALISRLRTCPLTQTHKRAIQFFNRLVQLPFLHFLVFYYPHLFHSVPTYHNSLLQQSNSFLFSFFRSMFIHIFVIIVCQHPQIKWRDHLVNFWQVEIVIGKLSFVRPPSFILYALIKQHIWDKEFFTRFLFRLFCCHDEPRRCW